MPEPKLSIYHALASIAQLLGVKPENELKYEDRLALADFLIQSYSGFTPDEMVVAVKMNLIGDLAPVKLPNGQTADRVECYGRIDLQYLTHVFTEYQKAKQRAMLAFKAADEKLKDQENARAYKPPTPAEHFETVKKIIKDTGNMPHFANWSLLFDYLYQEVKVFTVEELKAFMAKEKPKIIDEINAKLKTTANRSERASLEIDLQENSLNMELRKRKVLEYLKREG